MCVRIGLIRTVNTLKALKEKLSTAMGQLDKEVGGLSHFFIMQLTDIVACYASTSCIHEVMDTHTPACLHAA
jgi:hypothetical protein